MCNNGSQEEIHRDGGLDGGGVKGPPHQPGATPGTILSQGKFHQEQSNDGVP